MAIIYRHLKPCGEVFYIGIGGGVERAYKKAERNQYWQNMVAKNPNYEVQILKKDLLREDACELEKILISYYGRRDLGTGTLVNLTDGGDINWRHSKETIKKLSDNVVILKGEEHFNFGRIRSEETKEKISKAKKGFTLSEESVNKIVKTRRENTLKIKKYICIDTLKTWSTLKDCGKDINICSKLLQGFLNKNNNRTNPTKIALYEDYINGARLFTENRINRDIVDTRTGKVANKKEVAKELGIVIEYLLQMVGGSIPNKTYYVLKRKYDGNIHEPEVRKLYGTKVINTTTKQIFETIKQACDFSGISKKVLYTRLTGQIKNDTEYMLLKDYNNLLKK
jgi:hypothetical protein